MLDLAGLNHEQRAAVECVDGPLLVLAGAGSGKTRTLTYRIAHILDRGLASPHGILAITFTRQAAWELRRRLEQLVGKASADITAVTFHSLGYKILSAESGLLGYRPDALAICDGAQARRLLHRAMQETQVNSAAPDVGAAASPSSRWNVAEVAAIIERAKDNLYAPDDFVQVRGDFFEECMAAVYTRYQQLLKEINAVDYGDLIRLSVQLLRQNANTLAFYQQLFRYVSVDEFQDSSFGQYQLVRHLVWRHRNLCCVGSPVQAIYSWRGADIANILERFHADFPNAPKMVLHTNYRSTRNILSAAQQVVHNLPYREDLTTDREAGDPIALAASHTDRDEANYVAAEIERLVAETNYRYADCAILFRTRSQGRLLEQVLMHRKLPYTLVGDFRFFERREIKDLLAYLRLIHDLFDSGALQRIINRPPRGLGPAALAKLQRGELELTYTALSDLHHRTDLPERVRAAALEFATLLFDDLTLAAKDKTLPDLMDYVLERSGYRQWIETDPESKPRLANLAHLRVLAQRYEGGEQALGQFLADMAVLSDSRSMGDTDAGLVMEPAPSAETDGITLATIHVVKGLEFPIVFIVGFEEGIFPHAKAVKTPGGLEEEQRLAYVGMTRAKVKLYLSYARTRQVGGDLVEHTPSRFISVIPRALLEPVSASIPAVVSTAPDHPLQREAESVDDVAGKEHNTAPTEPNVELTLMLEPESEFERWLREGQSQALEHEMERANIIETWILAEYENDDTDLESEILADDEMIISDALNAELKETQRELLNHEMYLADLAYERDMETESRTKESNQAEEKAKAENEPEDFAALLHEYADEIAQHARDAAVIPGSREPMGVAHAIAE